MSSLAHRKLATASVVLTASLGLAAAASAAPAVVAHQKVSTVKLSLGRVLSSPAGRVMYLFAKDGKNVSNCSKPCQFYWPPVKSTSTPIAGPHVSAKHLGRTAAGQVTYYGHPLYYYLQDTEPKQFRGQGSNGSGAKWWVVGTNGKPIKS